MKRVFIVAVGKKHILGVASCLAVLAAILLLVSMIHFTGIAEIFNNSITNSMEDLEKENSMLNKLLCSLFPEEQKIITEDEYRNKFKNPKYTPPPPLPSTPLRKVIDLGVETKFRILSHDPQYLRPLFDPSWKTTYYRGWLYLPHKNLEARHKIFAFSMGGSANYDIFGSLGLNLNTPPSEPIDNHRNINFLIYGFDVNSVKVFKDQIALIGEPKQIGAQIVSIVQNDLLPEGVDTKDFLFQLSTPEGYEIDYLNQNIIRYEYLIKLIEEHTVHSAFDDKTEKGDLEKLLKQNALLKKELTYFIPAEDKTILQQSCESLINAGENSADIAAAIRNGSKIPFKIKFNNFSYKRPLYDPLWKVYYKRNWYYIPKQIEYNLHRLFILPQGYENQTDFFGTLGFHEKYQPPEPGQCGFMVYNFNVTEVIAYENQILLSGTPSRTGAQIVSVNHSFLQEHDNYLIRLITPDNSEVDCNVLR